MTALALRGLVVGRATLEGMRAPLVLVLALASPAAEASDVVAVFDLEAHGVRITDATRRALTDYAATRLAADDRYAIVPHHEIRSALRREKAESYRACYDEACQIEIGKEIAANLTLSTKVSRIGSSCVTTMRLYDLRSAATVRAATARGGCARDAWVVAVERCVDELLGRAAAVTLASRSVRMPPQPVERPARSIDAMTLDSAQLLARDGRWSKRDRLAARVLHRLADKSSDPSVHFRLGVLYTQGPSKHDDAITVFEGVLQRWPNDDVAPRARFELARLLVLRGELTRARAALGDTQDAPAALLRGEINRRESRWSEARGDYESARVDPQLRDAADYRLAWLAWRARRDDEARRRLDDVVANGRDALREAAQTDRAYFDAN